MEIPSCGVIKDLPSNQRSQIISCNIICRTATTSTATATSTTTITTAATATTTTIIITTTTVAATIGVTNVTDTG